VEWNKGGKGGAPGKSELGGRKVVSVEKRGRSERGRVELLEHLYFLLGKENVPRWENCMENCVLW